MQEICNSDDVLKFPTFTGGTSRFRKFWRNDRRWFSYVCWSLSDRILHVSSSNACGGKIGVAFVRENIMLRNERTRKVHKRTFNRQNGYPTSADIPGDRRCKRAHPIAIDTVLGGKPVDFDRQEHTEFEVQSRSNNRHWKKNTSDSDL